MTWLGGTSRLALQQAEGSSSITGDVVLCCEAQVCLSALTFDSSVGQAVLQTTRTCNSFLLVCTCTCALEFCSSALVHIQW